MNSKNSGLGLLFKTIFMYWNCFLSSGAEDRKDGHGLKLEKVEPTRKYPIRLGPLKRPPSIRGHLVFAFLVLFYVEVIESLISVLFKSVLTFSPVKLLLLLALLLPPAKDSFCDFVVVPEKKITSFKCIVTFNSSIIVLLETRLFPRSLWDVEHFRRKLWTSWPHPRTHCCRRR